jgi:CHAT domain-containing protein
LFGSIEDLIQGRRLLIVPSSALTQLPFEVLVTAKPDEKLPRFEAYKKVAWLGQRQAITILPSVGSLKALRTAKSSAAPHAFIGFGNSLLTGDGGKDRSAWAKQDCRKAAPRRERRNANNSASIASLFRSGVLDIEELRRQPPLPETADELCAVASGLGVPETELDKAVYLGERATVSQVKRLSQNGQLARARVIQFATHGLLAGQTALFAVNKAEPALLLTPPAAASEEDNGLLTASEVAQLNLDADWVVLSACNTAAGSNDGAEALSGLARAFFYAGARRLALGGGFRSRRGYHNGCGERVKSRAEDWPRGGAAPLYRRAYRERRRLRASERLGALRAGRQWRALVLEGVTGEQTGTAIHPSSGRNRSY